MNFLRRSLLGPYGCFLTIPIDMSMRSCFIILTSRRLPTSLLVGALQFFHSLYNDEENETFKSAISFISAGFEKIRNGHKRICVFKIELRR